MIQVEGISSGENLKAVLTEQDSIIDRIQEALVDKALPKQITIDVITAASLPATVVDNQIVVITSTAASKIYVSTNEPTSPTNGDIWVKVGSGRYGFDITEESPFFGVKFTGAFRYNSNSWETIDGYIGVGQIWQRFSVTLPSAGTSLSEWTWEQIIFLANSGENVREYFAVGDEKSLVLTTGETVTAVIGDFYHNTITGSGGAKAAISFTFKNGLNTKYQMSSTSTNSGGWDNSDMRKTHMPAILSTFPAVLRAEDAIKHVNVLASAGSTSTTLLESSDRLRLHSVTELGGTYSYAATGEGTQYAYYVLGNRVKWIAGKPDTYWTRSPETRSSSAFCGINSSGSVNDFSAGTAYGVACCFDI